MKAKVISMGEWMYEKEWEQGRELTKATQIMLLRFSFIHPHVILFPRPWRLVRVSGCLITVSTIPTGPFFCNSTMFLSQKYRRSHTDTHKHTHKHALTQMQKFARAALHLCRHSSQSHMRMFRKAHYKQSKNFPCSCAFPLHVGAHILTA